MPPKHGVGSDDDECLSPAGPQAAEPRPEQPVTGAQPRAPAGLSLQDGQLMTQRGVLGVERRVAPEGTVTLKETRLTDPQDDGLESFREPGMLGVGKPDSA